jgi:hypothetical protein
MVPGMIGKDYFKRQATTLRKMVKVAKDPMVADRLRDMAYEFEERARDGTGAFDVLSRREDRGADADEGHG